MNCAEYKDRFSERIEELRKERKLSKEEVADIMGVSRQTYFNYINGVKNPNLEGIINLAIKYDVSFDYLMGKTDYRSVSGEMISDHTGLSDNAIKTLESINNSNDDISWNIISALNRILDSGFATGVLYWIGIYLDTSKIEGYKLKGKKIPFDGIISLYDNNRNTLQIDNDIISQGIIHKIRSCIDNLRENKKS